MANWIDAMGENLVNAAKKVKTVSAPSPEIPEREDMCEGCELGPSVGASADDVLLCQKCLDLPGDDRCVHGVWAADHCYQCGPQEALVPAEDDLEGQVQFNERRIESLESALRAAREDRLRRNQDEVERERDYFYRAMATLRAERDGEREARKQLQDELDKAKGILDWWYDRYERAEGPKL